MKCRNVNKMSGMLLLLISVFFSMSAQARIEHIKQVYYDLKTGQQHVYRIKLESSNDNLVMHWTALPPRHSAASSFTFAPCRSHIHGPTLTGGMTLVAAQVVDDARLKSAQQLLDGQNIGIQWIKLGNDRQLLYLSQVEQFIITDIPVDFSGFSPCRPASA